MSSQTANKISAAQRMLDEAVARGDVDALRRAMESALADETPEVRLGARGLALLWVRAGFAAFLAAAQSVAQPWEVFRVLNSRARRLTGGELAQVVEAAGVPPADEPRTRLLFATLVAHPDPAVTGGLLAFIRTRSAKAPPIPDWAQANGELDSDTPVEVADAVGLLGLRQRPEAVEALIGLANDLPWKADPPALEALLRALLKHPDDRCREALWSMIQRHRAAGELRLTLLAAGHTLSPDDAEGLLLGDLQGVLDPETRWWYLHLWKTWRVERKRSATREAGGGRLVSREAEAQMARLRPDQWPMALGIMYLLIVRETMPDHLAAARGGGMARGLAGLIAGFEKLRMDLRRRVWMVPALFGGVILLSMGLATLTAARPTRVLPWVNGILVAWLLVMLLTARTRSVVEERPTRKLWYAILFWGVTVLLAVGVVGTWVWVRQGY